MDRINRINRMGGLAAIAYDSLRTAWWSEGKRQKRFTDSAFLIVAAVSRGFASNGKQIMALGTAGSDAFFRLLPRYAGGRTGHESCLASAQLGHQGRRVR